MQELILPKLKREEEDRPQINKIANGIQWIEVNRGCKRGCAFCYADTNYKVFDVPEIISNKVMIIGEGFLYDPKVKEKIIELGQKRVNGKVIYYGLNQGIDFRLLDKEIAELLSENRFGILNSKYRWYKGMKFAWDGIQTHEKLTKETIDLLVSVGYKRKFIQVFVLINWKIPYDVCIYKLSKLKEWGVKIDDCTWNSNKRDLRNRIKTNTWNNLYWTMEQYRNFRAKSRKHNQLVLFDGYDPKKKSGATTLSAVHNYGFKTVTPILATPTS